MSGRSLLAVLTGAAVAICALLWVTDAMAVKETDELEWELRCCFRPEEIEHVFLISLGGVTNAVGKVTSPVGHLKLVTPSGKIIGFDKKTGRFRRPTREGIYAASPAGLMDVDDIEWGSDRNRMLVLHHLESGTYRLSVYGDRERAGQYNITFLPVGKSNMNGMQQFVGARINPGEEHQYTFPGTFADVTQGLHYKEPNHFRVIRVE